MYPELLAPLLTALALTLLALLWTALRQPIARRLALRQIVRRKSEAALVVSGSVLGTAVIVGALIVGDTLDFSVRQEAYRTLGPVDERVVAPYGATADTVRRQLEVMKADPDVDGVLAAEVVQAAAVSRTGDGRWAEPRVLAWQLDFADASRFGRAGGAPGLSGPSPRPGTVVLNEPLARSLEVSPGDRVTLFLFGRSQDFQVDRVVPQRGLGGIGIGGRYNRNAYLPAGTLQAARAQAPADGLTSVVFLSNRGGVEDGATLSGPVTDRVRQALGPLSDRVTVDTPKQTVLREAEAAGNSLGSLFLMIGSFSIIAGAVLLVNLFVMLGEERKAQLGMMRAMGMKRSRLVGTFTLEGAGYAVLAVAPGIGLGLVVGWAVAAVAAEIFRGWNVGGSSLDIAFSVTPVSIVNGAALGLVISLTAITLTSLRISRFNIIAAIRDLPAQSGARPRRRLLAASTALSVLCAAAAVPALVRSQAEQSYLLPALAVAFAVPLLLRVLPRGTAVSLAAGAVLAWTLLAPVVRPRIFDTPSMAVYVIEGTLAAFSAVVLVSQNQRVMLRPLRRLLDRPSQPGLATRLAVAYPLAKRFRTGATLSMYTLITLVLVLLTEIAGMLDASVDRAVGDATAGYSMRVDFNPQAERDGLLRELSADTAQIAAVAPLLNATGRATDPGRRTDQPLQTALVGVPDGAVTGITFSERLPGLRDDRAVWQAVAEHPDLVVVDAYFGDDGGPAGDYYGPGDTLTLTDPRTGNGQRKTIAGILNSAAVFYPAVHSSSTVFPMVMGADALVAQFGDEARTASALLRTTPGTSPGDLAPRLQGEHLAASLVATPIADEVRRMFDASTAFFRLLQGFLALGLLVGVASIGVVMVRAVRERRRTIGILRALGFQARTVRLAFLTESAFVALEGIVLGSVLGVLTTWLMYLKSSAFTGLTGGFPLEWAGIGALSAAAFVSALLASAVPARRAAAVRPAVAVRVAD